MHSTEQEAIASGVEDVTPLRSNRRIGDFVQEIEQSRSKELSELSDIDISKKKYYADLLNLNDWSVDQLAIQPGESHFKTWFLISSYFPLIVGTIGPLSNMTNIVSLIDSWRVNKITGEKLADYHWLLRLNGISVMFALISNISLLMNTRRKLRYTISQVISISGWFIAATILMVLLITGHHAYFSDGQYRPSQGFWFAVMTVVLYYACFLVLVLNEIGFLLKKYPPVFNIDDVQKNLMVLVIMLMIFLICGSAIFAALMNVHFADALYFVVVTILTVGLGDFVPYNAGGKVLILIYSVVGLLLLALIISTIRELVIFSSSSTFMWHRVQKDKALKLHQLSKDQISLSDENSFNMMMSIQKTGLLKEKLEEMMTILTVFIAFWLLGAVVFCKAEGWDYGTSCYFCFLCLITIGYEVPSPSSTPGRAFFVVWGLCAVPLMTMLISNMSDVLFTSLKDTDNYSLLDPTLELISNGLSITVNCFKFIQLSIKKFVARAESEDKDEAEPDESEERSMFEEVAQEYLGSSIEELPKDASRISKDIREVLEITKELRKMIIISIEDPEKKFAYDEWCKLFKYAEDDYKLQHENFWVGEESPFKFPFKQCHFMEFKYLLTIERRLKSIMEDSMFDSMNGRLIDQNLSEITKDTSGSSTT